MNNKKNNKQLEDLKKVWDKRLADSGFVDIEDAGGSLKRFDSKYFASRIEPAVFQSTQRYYQLAGQLLNDYPFINSKERRVWKLHAEGVSERDISIELKCARRYVNSVIERVSRWVRV